MFRLVLLMIVKLWGIFSYFGFVFCIISTVLKKKSTIKSKYSFADMEKRENVILYFSFRFSIVT